MRDFFLSLPQGVYWYPVTLLLVVISVRSVLAIREKPERRGKPEGADAGALDRYIHQIRAAYADPGAMAELERVCIGMLLCAVGYRGYSVSNCRDYLDRGAPEAVESAIREHLAGQANVTGPSRRATRPAGLPPRCNVIVSYIEQLTEASSGDRNW